MGIFKKFFGGKKKVTDNEVLKKYTEISGNQEQIINVTEVNKPKYNGSLGFSIELSAERNQLKISSLRGPVRKMRIYNVKGWNVPKHRFGNFICYYNCTNLYKNNQRRLLAVGYYRLFILYYF